MLPTINGQNPAATGMTAAESVLPADTQLSGETADQASFALAQVVEDVAAIEVPEQMLEALPAVEPLATQELLDVEHWLSGMLAQQQIQVEAREPAQALEPELLAAPAPEHVAVLDDQVPQELRDMSKRQRAAVVLSSAALQQPTLALVRDANQNPIAPVAAAVENVNVAPVQGQSVLSGPVLERLIQAQPQSAEAPPMLLAANHAATEASTPVAPRTLSLQGAPAQFGEQMLHALRDQVDLQINQRLQNATIRLDPPELGSLEIYLSHESGRLNVQLSAANSEVARLLHSTSERLRQELVSQNFVQVNVQVSADAQGGRQQGQQARSLFAQASEPVREAASLETTAQRVGSDSSSSVLVTV